jgi:hypothetical protein
MRMHDLRKFMSWIYAISSVLGLWTAFWFIPLIIHRGYAFSPLRSLLISAVFPTLATIYGVAWWVVWKGKASAKGWGIAASLTYIPTSLLAIIFFKRSVWSCNGVVLATGIAGLVAFLQPYEQHNSSKNTAESVDYESSGPSF